MVLCKDIFFALVKSALTGFKFNGGVYSDFSYLSLHNNYGLYDLAISHSVANVVSIGLLNSGFNVEGTPFEQAELRAAYSDALIETMMYSIRSTFEKHHIAFVPLKGLDNM